MEGDTTKPTSVESTSDLLALDDRVVLLERNARTHSRHLVQFESVLIDQTVALAVLEIVFALFLACTLWVEYRRVSEVAHG
jgi:hypothetical protein